MTREARSTPRREFLRNTGRVPRQESPDPRRVSFLRKGVRTERTVVPSTGFPSAIMPEAACHPLFVAERFDGRASVAIACKNFKKLFNNNDCILRCLHSEPFPIEQLLLGQNAQQEGIILFCDGGHDEARAQFEKLTGPRWAGADKKLLEGSTVTRRDKPCVNRVKVTV
jgi:hypothetical protein